jgi:imidazole glycerol-phosphate synthase subunit HisH
MISIVDYGMGNLNSIRKAFHRINVPCQIATKPIDVLNAKKIILPGVGHFENGMRRLQDQGLIEILNRKAQEEKIPILGICLGAQLLTSHSEEGDISGLGWIEASTLRFRIENNTKIKVPHMGWNDLQLKSNEPIFDGITKRDQFYFVHSFYIKCIREKDSISKTEYQIVFDSVIKKENIIGVQFHPEKSHDAGLRILHNFSKL